MRPSRYFAIVTQQDDGHDLLRGMQEAPQQVFSSLQEAPATPYGKSQMRPPHLRLAVGVALLIVSLMIGLYVVWRPMHFVMLVVLLAASFPLLFSIIRPRAKNLMNVNYPLQSAHSTDLGRYTVLFPIFHEANMMPQIRAQVSQLNYPGDKLEVLILMEAADHATQSAAMAQTWPDYCRLVVVPEGQPRTKARACNYGLEMSTGTYLVIYDAEDKPHPDQLLHASLAFARSAEDVACLQAPLRIQASGQGWLQHQFCLEYRILFLLTLPVLSYLDAVVPLGGSSNHFRASYLRAVGGWDDYNLTEDAELSMRLAKHHYTTKLIRSTTVENAPLSLRVFMNQRTRWLTGHIQTLHQHMASPLATLGLLGWRRCILANIILMSRLVIGITHTIYLLSTIYFTLPILTGDNPFGAEHAAPITVLAGYLIFSTMYFLIGLIYLSRMPMPYRIFIALTQTFYWAITSVALVRALKRVLAGQLNWLKTPHRPFD
jgi:cellulose synthase/poly-beta-1,6-N-acetylglucosamine synthase-like glycosyltransferase